MFIHKHVCLCLIVYVGDLSARNGPGVVEARVGDAHSLLEGWGLSVEC